MSTTFVSCAFQYDETLLEKWIHSKINMVLYVDEAHFEWVSLKLSNSDHSIVLKKIPNVSELEWFSENVQLPKNRNEQKDTLDHLWNTHLKVYCLYHTALLENEFETSHFAYIDFHAPNLFQKEFTLGYLKANFGKPHLFTAKPNQMYLPGCWGKAEHIGSDFSDSVHWRFCGSFMFGSFDAIVQFYQHYSTYFSDFLDSQNRTLGWEVNYWAYMETTIDDWNPIWYQANHDDSMVYIPGVFGYKKLADYPDTVTQVYDYPNMSPYRPMSAAYVVYKDRVYLNTRYVNYWIYDNGSYYYPEDEGVIRTLNVCSEMSPESPLNYQIMTDICPFASNAAVFSEGLEDIRLYVSNETGELCFIATTMGYSHTDRIRMIRGVYDVEAQQCRNFQNLDPPQETWCEKNWAPIPLPDGSDGFVYKWYPLEIGKVVKRSDADPFSIGKLEIVVEKEMDTRFKNMKGSTPFVAHGEKYLIGVVHFSEEMRPRQYYHRVVILDKTNFDVVKCSDIFCFMKASVEFCIGCRVRGNKMGFWISKMDRDPMYVEIDMKCIGV